MFIFHYTVEDADTDKASITLAFTGDPALPTNLLQQAVSDVWTLIAPLVNGKLVSASITLPADVSAFNTAAAVIADVQEKASFTFRTLNNGVLNVTLPTFVETYLTASGAGKTVDISNADVAAFITLFNGDGLFVQDGFDPESVYPANRHGEEAFGTIKAYEAWGKQGRR